MDENPDTQNDSKDEIFLPEKAPQLDPKILIGVVGLVFLGIFVVLTISSKLEGEPSIENPASVVLEQGSILSDEPTRVESGNDVPEAFPTELILEENLVVNEGYTLQYLENQQVTVTFLSQKTVTEVYEAYTSYLESNAWAVMRSSEVDTIASIYALKRNDDLNVTISRLPEDESTTVTLSLIKR